MRFATFKVGARLSVAVIFAAIFGAAAGCDHGGQKAQATDVKPPPPMVTIAVAAARDVPVYLEQIGRAVPRESVSLMPQVSGRVTAVHFVEGADVTKGQLLFEIDQRPFQATLAKEQAQLAQYRVNHQRAEEDWKRVEGLIQSKAVSKEEYDQRKTTAAAAEAQVKWAEAAVEQARLNLEYCTIKSPIDGRTGQVLADPGNIVKENETALVTIQRLNPIYADFTVTERELQDVRANMARGTLTVQVRIPDEHSSITVAPTTAPTTAPAADVGRVGALTFLDNVVQDVTGTVKLRATMPNEDRYFWPGQFVNVRLVLATKKDAVLVPGPAVQIGQQGPFVFVVKADQTAEIRPIVRGHAQDDQVVIERGVSAGEQVIIAGQMQVVPGAPVTVTNAPAASGAPSAAASAAR